MPLEETRGGARQGAGRKPKIDEVKLIEKLSPMDDIALELLKKLIQQDDFNALKLFMEYRYGKAKQFVDVTSDGDKISIPIISFDPFTEDESDNSTA